jgi:hypothetical protein
LRIERRALLATADETPIGVRKGSFGTRTPGHAEDGGRWAVEGDAVGVGRMLRCYAAEEKRGGEDRWSSGQAGKPTGYEP